MQKNKRIQLVAVLLGISVMCMASTYLYSQRMAESKSQLTYVSIPATPFVNNKANEKFNDIVLSGNTQEINNGLSIQRLNLVALKGVPTPSANHISLLILNHTEEPIEFENIGFDIQVFEYDASAEQWNKVTLPFTPDHKNKIVPAKLEEFDFDVLNSWEMTEEDFINSKTGKVRILISGIGLDTNKKYYAFADITLQK